MIEQYVFNKVTGDAALQALLTAGGGKYHIYPTVVPKTVSFTKAVTFTLLTTFDAYPAVQSVNVQFNIFAAQHGQAAAIASALADVFNDDNNQSDGGVNVVYSIRKSETDLGYNFDDKLYQREATYYFKLR